MHKMLQYSGSIASLALAGVALLLALGALSLGVHVASAQDITNVTIEAESVILELPPEERAKLEQKMVFLTRLLERTKARLATQNGSGVNFSFTADLSVGTNGQAVVALQNFLVVSEAGPAAEALADTFASGTSKGHFGELTRAALAEYQASADISPAVGYFGPLTRAHIGSLRASR